MKLDHTININTSVDALWTLLTEVEQVKRWIPELVSDDPITPGPVGVGTKTRMRLREGSKIADYNSEILAHQPGSYLEMRLTGGNLGAGPMTVGYRLSSSGTGSTLRYTTRWRPHGVFLWLLSPLITAVSRHKTKGHLGRLKALAESTT